MGSARILDGKATARAVRSEVASRVSQLRQTGLRPCLAVVIAGHHPPSAVYVRNKERACTEVGIDFVREQLTGDTDATQVVSAVEKLNADPMVNGIIVQLPLPEGIDVQRVIDRIAPEKDVDGLTSTSLGRLLSGCPDFVPATPAGIVELLVRNHITISGRRVVIVGRSSLVGKSLANLLLLRGHRGNATVTVCHTATPDLAQVCREGEILVVAAGKTGLVTGDMIADGAVVIDAGINRTPDGLAGDVDFASAEARASAITPVPGGVGPMTVAMLLFNVVRAAARQGTTDVATRR